MAAHGTSPLTLKQTVLWTVKHSSFFQMIRDLREAEEGSFLPSLSFLYFKLSLCVVTYFNKSELILHSVAPLLKMTTK